MKLVKNMLMVIFIFGIAKATYAHDQLNACKADRLPSSGIYAYVADLYVGLRIIDVSDPANPNEVGFYDTPGDVRDVYVSENYAYIADGGPGLRIIDVSDPANPFEAGFHDTPGYACGVYVSGIYAYVADAPSGLRIIDVSDPTNPFEVGYCDTLYCGSEVYVSGNYAYAGASNGDAGVLIIDVSDPANPYPVNFYATSPFMAEETDVSGRYAYIAKWTPVKRAPVRWDIFEIIDVSDPTNPFYVGGYELPSIAMGLHVVGNYAYVAAYEAGLQIIDISVPTNPFVVGYYDTPGNYNYEVYVLGNYAYVADFGGYFRVIDISDPTIPSQVGLIENIWGAYAVHVVDYESPQVSVISPNGGEILVIGDTCDIAWSVTDNVGIDSITILYSIDAGMSWDTIATGEPNDSLYEWIILDTQSDSCLVKILAYDPGLNFGEDQSDSFFTISPSAIEENISSPKSPFLFQIAPNPFKEKTEITFSIGQSALGGVDSKQKSVVSLKIYDVSGRLVKDFPRFTLDAQRPTLLSWDGRDDSGNPVQSGVYFCRFVAGDYYLTKKLLLLQ